MLTPCPTLRGPCLRSFQRKRGSRNHELPPNLMTQRAQFHHVLMWAVSTTTMVVSLDESAVVAQNYSIA